MKIKTKGLAKTRLKYVDIFNFGHGSSVNYRRNILPYSSLVIHPKHKHS